MARSRRKRQEEESKSSGNSGKTFMLVVWIGACLAFWIVLKGG